MKTISKSRSARPLRRIHFDLPGGTLSALRFGDSEDHPRLVFCHANGFNAQSYRAVIAPLNVPALALDLRGHGRTQLPTHAQTLSSWQIFADDIAAFFDRYIDGPVVLAGHSYGAVSAILSLRQTRHQVAGYVGFDPVLVPALFRLLARSSSGRAYMKRRIPIARKAGQRKSRFDSLEAAFARYQGRGAFRGVPDPVLRDYLEGGLIEDDEGVRLACDPDWEQAIFAAQGHRLSRAVSLLPDNSRIIFAGSHGSVSTPMQRRALQRKRPEITVEFRKDLTHLFPLQQTELATEALRQVLSRAEPDPVSSRS